MVALAAALGVFHVAQQGVHLGNCQTPVGAHGTVASHGAEQLIEVRLNAITGAVLHKVGKHVLHQAVGFSLLEQGRDLANRQGLGAQALQFEAQALKPLCMLRHSRLHAG